jgi:hypothetical protein
MSFVVKVPRRSQGIPPGLAEAASSRDPQSLEAIEAKAIEAVRGDPWRAYEWVVFGDSPLPSEQVMQKVTTNPHRGPLDAAEVTHVSKTVHNSPSWKPARLERVKGGKVLPADTPSTFETEADAAATLERFRRLGSQAGVPMAAHLQYGVVCPLSEWEVSAGQATVDRERQQIQAEVELVGLSESQRSIMARIKELQAQLDRPSAQHSDPPARNEDVPEHGSEEWKAAIVAAVRGGEGSTSVARRFNTNDRQVRRYMKRAQPAPVAGQMIDPALLGE